MEIEYFKEKIEKLNSDKEYKDFAMEILSQTIPWFFQEKFKTDAPSQYSKFKLYISKKFKVSPNDVALGGSSWLGFSLSPDKNFRNFNKESDIDIVIVSRKLFENFWDCYLNGLVYKKLIGVSYENISKNTFKRYVHYQDNANSNFKASFYVNFQKQVSGYAKDLQIGFDFPEHIGYRIYRSWDDYNLAMIHTLKDIKEYQNGNSR